MCGRGGGCEGRCVWGVRGDVWEGGECEGRCVGGGGCEGRYVGGGV